MDSDQFPFKRMFWSYVFCFTPFSLLAGILALFNVSAVNFNGTPRYGIEGFLIAVLLSPFTSLIFSVLNWLALNFGNKLYNEFTAFLKKRSN